MDPCHHFPHAWTPVTSFGRGIHIDAKSPSEYLQLREAGTDASNKAQLQSALVIRLPSGLGQELPPGLSPSVEALLPHNHFHISFFNFSHHFGPALLTRLYLSTGTTEG